MANQMNYSTDSINESMNAFGYDDRGEGREARSRPDSDRSRELLIGSAALAAAAIATIMVLQHRRNRENAAEPWVESLAELEAPGRHVRHVGGSRAQQLAERQFQRVGNMAEDVLDALVGAAFGKMISLIGDAIPSFRSEYERNSMSR